METTTIRVSRKARTKLKVMAARARVTISTLVDEMVDEREKSFWDGFDEEAVKFKDSAEKKARRSFDGSLPDGIGE